MHPGLIVGPVFVVLFFVADALGPTAWRALWIAVALQMARTALVFWRRARLPRWAAGGFVGAAGALLVALASAGRNEFRELMLANPIATITVVLAVPVLMFSEAKFAPAKWKRVRERGESATLRDMFTLRHIPDLR